MFRVLLVASEAYPLAKTGGLADCVAGLAKALSRKGCDVKLLLPDYPEALDRLTGCIRWRELGIFLGLCDAALVEGREPRIRS